MFLGCGNGAVRVFGRPDDPIARIVLDQIFERFRKLTIVLDDQDPEHPRDLPMSRNFRENPSLMLARICSARESPVNEVYVQQPGAAPERKEGARSEAPDARSPLKLVNRLCAVEDVRADLLARFRRRPQDGAT